VLVAAPRFDLTLGSRPPGPTKDLMPPEAPWRSRPILICSTFRDMQAERDYLVREVFPELQEQLREYRTTLEPVDLWMGVEAQDLEQEQAEHELMLQVCLDEVERSRPFFIVLLGDHYGWVPPKERMDAAVQQQGFATETTGKSVTALQIEFAALRSPQQRVHAFCYFRQPLPYDEVDPASGEGMAAEAKAVYSDQHAADPGHEDRHQRLQALKAQLKKKLPNQCRDYAAGWDWSGGQVTALEQLGEQVTRDLLPALIDEAEQLTAWAAASQALTELEQFVEQQRRGFVGRQQLVNALVEHVTSPPETETRSVCITGASGSGKSALFAHLCRQLRGVDDLLVLAHAAGGSPTSNSVDAMLRRWIEQLANHLGVSSPLPDEASAEEVERDLYDLLSEASLGRRVVLLIDALDQFERTARARQLSWLPEYWPDNVRLVATALPGSESEVLAGHADARLEPLHPLSEREARQLARSVYARYHREPNQAAVDVLLEKQSADNVPAAENPLWLTLAVEQLCLVEQEALASTDPKSSGATEQQLQTTLVDEARAMPPTVRELYAHILEHAEQAYGKPLTRAFAALVGVSRGGLRKQELEPLIPQVAHLLLPGGAVLRYSELSFAALRRGLRAHLVCRGPEGRWDFFHAPMRTAVVKHLLSQPERKMQVHARIAEQLTQLAAGDPLRHEIMFHLIGADDQARAADYYAGELPTAEKAAATRALAELIAQGADRMPNPGLRWTVSLLEQPSLEEEVVAGLCSSFNFDLSDALQNDADLATRRAVLESTRAALAELARADPSHEGWQRDLALVHDRISDVLLEQGELEQALDCYRTLCDIQRHLVEIDPSNIDRHRDLALSHDRVGDVLLEQGELEQALVWYRASREIRERVVATDPSNLEWQRDFALSHALIGDVLLEQGQLSQALEFFRVYRNIRKRLANADPSHAGWQRDLALSHDRIGDVLLEQGQLGQALDSYRASLTIRERLAETDPSQTSWQRDLSVSHNTIGDVLRSRGQLSRALDSYRASLAIREHLAQADPAHAGWQRDLSVSYNKIGDLLREQGNLAEALDCYRTGFELRERLVEADPADVSSQRDLAVSHSRIGDVLREQGQLAQALDCHRAALEIRERLAQADLADTSSQRDLAVSHSKIGDVLREQGQLAESLDYYRACLDIAEQLAHSDPSNATWQRDLAVYFHRLARIHKALGQAAETTESLRRCRDTLREMRHREMHLGQQLAKLLAQFEEMGLD
jgi:tetratricopeptide (TPR) repeat protein